MLLVKNIIVKNDKIASVMGNFFIYIGNMKQINWWNIREGFVQSE